MNYIKYNDDFSVKFEDNKLYVKYSNGRVIYRNLFIHSDYDNIEKCFINKFKIEIDELIKKDKRGQANILCNNQWNNENININSITIKELIDMCHSLSNLINLIDIKISKIEKQILFIKSDWK
jgi:propanediol dehydratase large subunit